MLFTSFAFLGFFVAVFAIYWRLPTDRLRAGWLLVASAAYYMSWNPWLIGLILFSASVDYLAALVMERTVSPLARRALLVGSIGINLGLLVYFKYANFFLDQASWGLSLFGLHFSRGTVDVLLPLGISFYTFETISYICDVYWGKSKPVRNPLDYFLFILFFPHLLAGPIVRAGHFLPQVERPKRLTGERAWAGVLLILRGVFKKAILADHLAALVVDPVFATPGAYDSSAVWLAVFAYAVQIFCDFSGYSDMALGLASLLDFRLPQNFNHPYLATSPAEFWRRWHISLSTWLRDYVFIPLGGSRGGRVATCRNLLLVMLVGGLWHGAAWTFVVWGLYHGLLLVLHRAVRWPAWLAHPLARPLCVLGTFLLVCFGWVLFRSPSFAWAGVIFQMMFVPTPGLMLGSSATALVLAGLAFVVVGGLLGERGLSVRWERRLPAPVLGGALAAALTLLLLFWPEQVQTFIYFQF